MATCPHGHESAATDYCDECGTAIQPATVPAPPAGGKACPDCGATV